jgi:SAM-dependent methyltransferase
MPPRADYGVDAPYAPIIFGIVALAAGVVAAISIAAGRTRAALISGGYFVFFAGNMASFLYTTRRGKRREWERILEDLQLRGDEQVLDVGCGRGAVLTAVARRLDRGGRVTGIDIWSARDQSGNSRSVTLENAAREGVSARVAVDTGDMRALPYADGSFDLVVSSLAIHNISPRAQRAQAVREAFRVLEPGGRIVLADIRSTKAYAATLRQLGAVDVRRRRLGWRFWWGNPFAATSLVTAAKPAAAVATK